MPKAGSSKRSVAMKAATSKVRKTTTKKPAAALKAKTAQPKKEVVSPLSLYEQNEKAAIEVCRRLTKGQVRASDLGKTPDTKGYVLMRDFAKKYMGNKANYNKFQKTHCLPAIAADSEDEGLPAMDPVLTMVAYLPAELVDGDDKVDDFKILFSDEKDKTFFSLGVVNGYFRGDSANQIYHDFLVKKKYKSSQIAAQLGGKNWKIMENLMVKSQGMSVLKDEH